MGTVRIGYVRGKALFRSTERLSVEIDGESAGEIPGGKEISLDLPDGPHEAVVRAGHCRKTIVLRRQGDDSFVVTWDRVTGGLTVCEEAGSYFAAEKRRHFRIYVVLAILIASYLAVTWLYYGGLLGSGLFISAEIVLIAALLGLLVSVIAVRRRKIFR